MKKMIRLALVAGAVAALASALAIAVRAEPTNHANRLEVTFGETPALITDRVADLGIFQLILTASGTLDGFGPVTEVVSVTQDRAVHPCGPGSDSESATRRIVAGDGTLAHARGGNQMPDSVRSRLQRQLRGRRPIEHRRLRRRPRQRRRDGRYRDPHGNALREAQARRFG